MTEKSIPIHKGGVIHGDGESGDFRHRSAFIVYRHLDPVRAAALQAAVQSRVWIREVEDSALSSYDPITEIVEAAKVFEQYLTGEVT